MSSISLAWQILAASFLSIGRNWSVVLRATVVPLVLPLGVLAAWGYWAYTTGYALRYLPRHVGGNADFPFFAALLLLLAVFGTLPVAVAWHRFDLMKERPRLLFPRVGFGRVMGYFGRSLLIGLVTALTTLIAMLPLFLVADQGPEGFNFQLGALPQPMTSRNFALNLVLWSVVMAWVLRWSLILPGGAVGRNLSLREARQAAAARLPFGVFLVLGLFLHLAPIGLDLLLAEIAPGSIGGLLVLPFILLFWFMFGIALLTRLYAHCVEENPLQHGLSG
jgi:hypothetical protein